MQHSIQSNYSMQSQPDVEIFTPPQALLKRKSRTHSSTTIAGINERRNERRKINNEEYQARWLNNDNVFFLSTSLSANKFNYSNQFMIKTNKQTNSQPTWVCIFES